MHARHRLVLAPPGPGHGDQRLRPLRPPHPGLPHERGRRARVRGPGDDRGPRPSHRRGQGEVLLRQLREQRVLVQQAGPPAAPELRAGDVRRLHRRTRSRPSSTTTASTPGIAITTTGASFGAYHAANTLLKHPDLFRRCLALSGVYDIRRFMDGDYDDNFYFNNPVDYVANLQRPLVPAPSRASATSGWPRAAAPARTAGPPTGSPRSCARAASPTRWTTGAPEGGHDWPYWKRQMDEYMGRFYY